MPLQIGTYRKAADRRRFVNEKAAMPFLTAHERANRVREARTINRAIKHVVESNSYGTKARVRRAGTLLGLVRRLYIEEMDLAHFPPPGESQD
jgi:hypothetical protein